jgi:hypothetical protein
LKEKCALRENFHYRVKIEIAQNLGKSAREAAAAAIVFSFFLPKLALLLQLTTLQHCIALLAM